MEAQREELKKAFGVTRCLSVAGQKFCLQTVFVTNAADLKLSSVCREQFKRLPWKMVCPVQVNLQRNIICSLLVQLHVKIVF